MGTCFIPITPDAARKLGLAFGARLRLDSGGKFSEALFLGWLNPRGLARCYGPDVLTKHLPSRPTLFCSYLQLDDRGREFGLGLEPLEGSAPSSLAKGPVSLSLGEPFLQVPAGAARKQKGGELQGHVLAACEASITLGLGWPDLKKIGAEFTTEAVTVRIGEDERRVHLKTGPNKPKIEAARKKAKPSERPPLLGEAIPNFDFREKQFFLLTALVGERVGLGAKTGDTFLVKQAN